MRQPSPVSYRIVEECFTDALQPCEKAPLGFVSEGGKSRGGEIGLAGGDLGTYARSRCRAAGIKGSFSGSGHQRQLLGQPCRYEATRCRVLWAFTWPISLIGHACESKRLFS